MATIPHFHAVWDDTETFDGKAVSMDLTIVPYIDSAITASDDDLTTLSPTPVKATMTDGVMYDENGHPYVDLPCDSDLLGLQDTLTYLVKPSRAKTATGLAAKGFRAFTFPAPTTSGDYPINQHMPVPGTPGMGTTRGPSGSPVDDVELVGGDVQFYVQGTPVGDPLDLDVLVFDMTSIDGGTADAEGLETIDGGGPEVSGSTVDLKRMQQRRGLATAWTSGDPILSAAEFGVSFNGDGTVAAIKVGDGIHHWSALPNLVAIWGSISGQPAVVAAGADQAAARAAISVLSATEVASAITAAFAALVAGAPGALDTWLEVTAAITADQSGLAALTTVVNGKQPGDPDLTAIAALTTTAFGRGLLTLTDAAALLSAAGAQAVNAGLTAISALTTQAYGRSLLTLADAAAARQVLNFPKWFSTADYAQVSGDDRPRVLAAVNAAVAAMTATGQDQVVLIHGPLTFTTGSTKAALGTTADPDNIAHPNVGVPIPCNLAHILHIVYAPGAEITLSSQCNNVFYTDKLADYDTFRNVHFYNAWTDAGTSVLNEGHALIGNSLSAYPNGPLRYMNFENIKFFGYTRFRNFNWSANGTTSGQAGIVFRGEHNGPLEATQTHSTDIYLENGDQEGGTGLLCVASVESETEYRPGGANHWYDNIVVDQWRCVMPTPPTAYGLHADTGIFLVGTGFGGRIRISNGYAENMGDDGIEVGTCQQLDIINTVVKNAWFVGVFIRQQHAPLNVETQQINITGLRCEITPALANTAFFNPLGFLADDQHIKVSSTATGGSGNFNLVGFGPTGPIPWNASKAAVAAAFVAIGCTGTVCTGAATLNVATPSSPMIIHVAGCDSANPITWTSSLTGGSLTLALDPASNASFGHITIRDAILIEDGLQYSRTRPGQGMMIYGLDQAHRKITLDNVTMVLKDFTMDGATNADIALLQPGGPYPGWGNVEMRDIHVALGGTCDFTVGGHRANLSEVAISGQGTRVSIDGFTEDRSGALDGAIYMVSAGLLGSNTRCLMRRLAPRALAPTTYNAGVGLFNTGVVDRFDVFDSDFSKGTSSASEAIDVGSAGSNLAALRKGNNIFPEYADLGAVMSETAKKTANYTATANQIVPADATAGAITITFPTAPADKARIIVKKVDASANAVNLALGGSDVFNLAGGSTTGSLTLQNQAIQAQYAAATGIWYVISTDVPLTGLALWLTTLVATWANKTLTSPTFTGTVNGGNLVPNSVTLPVNAFSWWNGSDYTVLNPAASAGAQTVTLPTGATPTLRATAPRVNAMTFSATPTFDLALYDQFEMTLTGAITGATFSNGVDGASYRFRFKDNATARAIALGASARAVGVTIPTTTVISKLLYLVGVWNGADSKMDFVGVAQEA